MKPLPHHDAVPLHPPLGPVQLLIDQRDWAGAGRLLESLESVLAALPSSVEYGELCLLRARLAHETARYRDAIDWGRRALSIFLLTSTDHQLGGAQSLLGRAYLGGGDTKNASIHARDALAIYRRLSDEPGMVRAFNDLARIYFVRGEYGAAVDHLGDALEIAERIGDTDSATMLLGNTGRVQLLQGQWPKAEDSLKRAHTRATAAGNQPSTGRNLLSLAYLAVLRHDFKLAGARLDAALTVIEQAGLLRERAIYFEYSGWCQFEQHHWIAAKEAFRRALEIGRKLSPENDLISQSLRGLAECEAALGDWPEAARLAREGLKTAIAIGERAEVGSLYRVLARAAVQMDDLGEAPACLEKAAECLDLVGDPYELARLDVARAEVFLRSPADGALAAVGALQEAIRRFDSLAALDQADEARWLLVDALSHAGRMGEAIAVARELVGRTDSLSGANGRARDLARELSAECVRRSLSTDNEFRLAGMPWSAVSGGSNGIDPEPSTDELQAAMGFARGRIGASRVLLLEITADGRRTGRVIAQAGADEQFAGRLAAFAASAYQTDLPSDTPRFHWTLLDVPQLQALLHDESGASPAGVISVPVELGPQSSGLLYADRAEAADPGARDGFEPRAMDFLVAFAEVIAWRSTKLRSEGLLRDVQRLRDQLGHQSDFPSIITHNPELRETLARVRLVVDADVSVLLQGETGTGKDLLARAIHYSSNRRDKRCVSVNCAALPETLLESELFGVRRGAFTGADRDKTGLFEEADGGTFFLDEIGEMPVSIQVKLLRLLESKELVRLGDTKPRKVDVRVISASNRDLTEEMEKGAFRRDLYYRLTPIVFTLPPLRERQEDIPLLIDHFLAVVAEQAGRTVRLAAESVRLMCAYHWPGNVRELENEIRKLVLLSEPGVTVGPERLSRKFLAEGVAAIPTNGQEIPARFSLYDHVAQIEKNYIVRALAQTGGVKKHAASRLGIPESTLRLKMKIYSLDQA